MELFQKINKEEGRTIILITHNDELAAETHRIVTLRDGKIISDVDNREKWAEHIIKMQEKQAAEKQAQA